ncbi:MAG: radical SAM protein [bacterium]|nr:radical SAM protein [bacterium]
MRVFLGNAPWRKEGFYGVRAGSRWPHFERCGSGYMPFPFFLAYATAVLEQAGIEVLLVDGIAEELSEEQFITRIEQFQPHLVVLEVSTSSIDIDITIAKKIKQKLPATKLTFCGPHLYMYQQNFLEEHPELDFILQGEYEYTLRELVQRLQNQQELSSVLGLIYRQNGTVIVNPRRPEIENLDELPWPSRKMLPMYKYCDLGNILPLPSVQMWASRGCPYQCIFCSWPQIMYGGHKYRVRNPVDVVNEMEWLIQEYGFKSVYFDDDTFNLGKERMLRIADEIKKRNMKVPWAIMARADTTDFETLKAMRDAGMVALKYGVESGVQEIVNASQKNLDLNKVAETVKRTKELGIKVHLTFCFGLPGETKETIKQTVAYALQLDPDTVQFSIVTPYPGSKYFDMLDKQGYILSKNWEEYDGYHRAVIRTDNLTQQDLEDAVQYANRMWERHRIRRTLRPEYFWSNIRKAIRDPKKAIQKIKQAL